MEINNIYKILEHIEESISVNKLFLNYCFVLKSELINSFKNLYESLPEYLISKRDYLIETKPDNTFVQLNKINKILMESVSFGNIMIINSDEISKIIDRIYSVLPEDIAEYKTDKDFFENKQQNIINDIEIPDFLKKK